MPRLEPIEKPDGFMLRTAYWGIRRQFGKVITPVKVVIARMPGALKLTNEIAKFEMKGIRLDPGIHLMVGTLASQINGCSFCTDLWLAMAVREHLSLEKLKRPPRLSHQPALFRSRARRPSVCRGSYAFQTCL